MTREPPAPQHPREHRRLAATIRLANDFCALSRRIVRYANRGSPRVEFLKELSRMLLDFSACDGIELWLSGHRISYRWTAEDGGTPSHRAQPLPDPLGESPAVPGTAGLDPGSPAAHAAAAQARLDELARQILTGDDRRLELRLTVNGSFWTPDTGRPLSPVVRAGGAPPFWSNEPLDGDFKSLAFIPFVVGEEDRGLLQLKSRRRYFFTQSEIDFYEGMAQTLGLAVADRRAQADLRERMKELACLYGIERVTVQAELSLEQQLAAIVELLPPAWQHPEIAAARITIDGHDFASRGFRTGGPLQSAPIVVAGRERGRVEVAYVEAHPGLEPGLFLVEEHSLIQAVARELAVVIERREAGEERARLQAQLQHADRLATIGQLAAGVAHQLNEPLANILGFGQLARKNSELPSDLGHDLDRIVHSALYAREVVRKLLFFARRVPPQERSPIDLNEVVHRSLELFDLRLARRRVDLDLNLAPALPKLAADPAQLTQVVVNLLVNAVQAMPEGGRLKVSTGLADDGQLQLVVADSGVGMTEEVRRQVFLPFFSTKEVGEGTGLGLAVVHGIVAAHGGTIGVESQPGAGARFEVRLPLTGPSSVDCRDGAGAAGSEG